MLKQTLIFLFSCLFFISVPFEQLVQAEQPPQDEQSVKGWIENEDHNTPNDTSEGRELLESELGDDPMMVQDQSLFLVFLQMILALVVVVGLIYVLLRFINKRTQTFRSHQTIQNIGGVGLGANRSVQLIKVGEKLIVVGVGETISLLKEIDNDEEIRKILQQQQSQVEQFDQSFMSLTKWLQDKLLKKGQNDHKKQIRFGQLLEDRLGEVKKTKKDAMDVLKEKEND